VLCTRAIAPVPKAPACPPLGARERDVPNHNRNPVEPSLSSHASLSSQLIPPLPPSSQVHRRILCIRCASGSHGYRLVVRSPARHRAPCHTTGHRETQVMEWRAADSLCNCVARARSTLAVATDPVRNSQLSGPSKGIHNRHLAPATYGASLPCHCGLPPQLPSFSHRDSVGPRCLMCGRGGSR
jgi:hypothetical protein